MTSGTTRMRVPISIRDQRTGVFDPTTGQKQYYAFKTTSVAPARFKSAAPGNAATRSPSYASNGFSEAAISLSSRKRHHSLL